VANYLLDKNVGDGRYTYSNLPSATNPLETETISNCPSIGNTRDVHQYGVDYVRITCPGEHTLNFEGSVQVDLLPVDPHSGEYGFWSNKGDESDMTLTRRFDFRDHSGPLTFNYWTWYDLEDNFDYVYLLASQDGETWQILTTPSGTPDDPTGRSYGWAYNGESIGNDSGTGQTGWVHESIDISHLAGKQVYLRFEYLTDAAVNGEGFLLDDIAIPQTGYIADFEQDDGGWTGEGFVRIQNHLPQTFRLAVIRRGGTTSVDHYTLDGDNALIIPLEIGGDVEEVVLVISGTTRFTRQKAAYRFSIE
ncbi:MAG: immune inhibitor A, partial [Chloroflexota bacterium]|nr:immune inhibitor A [Chloroflexota bacterium]